MALKRLLLEEKDRDKSKPPSYQLMTDEAVDLHDALVVEIRTAANRFLNGEYNMIDVGHVLKMAAQSVALEHLFPGDTS